MVFGVVLTAAAIAVIVGDVDAADENPVDMTAAGTAAVKDAARASVQVVNGALLPLPLVFILRLVNNREIMGEHVNGRVYNALAWATVAIVAALSALMVLTTVLPALGIHLLGL